MKEKSWRCSSGQRLQSQCQKKLLDSNDNGNTTHQNLWETIKAALREKLIPVSAYIKKAEKTI